MTDPTDVYCSDVQAGPLPGTAKTGSVYVLLEWPGAWSRDVLDGATLGEELTARLKAHLARFKAQLLLVRHSSRERRQIDDHHVYLVFAEQAITEVLHVDAPEDVLGLDLSGPGRNGAQLREKPLVLVCTHGKRDRCCAVKGRSLIRELERDDDIVWETSHIKGHRFAPTMLVMPWAYSFGRMSTEAAGAMIDHALAGEYFVPGNRGRGTLRAPAQVAEVAVAAELARAGEPVRFGQLLVDATETRGAEATVTVSEAAPAAPAAPAAAGTDRARRWRVELEKREVDGVISSCGSAPSTGVAWVAQHIREFG